MVVHIAAPWSIAVSRIVKNRYTNILFSTVSQVRGGPFLDGHGDAGG